MGRVTENSAGLPAVPFLGSLEGRVFDAVAFDMDGTLIDSTPAVERSWRAWAIHYGITAEQLADSHGKPAQAIIDQLIPESGRAEARAYVDHLEITDVSDVVPLPGAVEALSALTDERRAIATSCTRPLMNARIDASRIPVPGVTVTIDDVDRGKPNPDPFLRAAEWLHCDPTRVLVVEDAVSGLTGARAAGCATLSVVTTTSLEKIVASGCADGIVHLLDEVRFVQESTGVRIELR